MFDGVGGHPVVIGFDVIGFDVVGVVGRLRAIGVRHRVRAGVAVTR